MYSILKIRAEGTRAGVGPVEALYSTHTYVFARMGTWADPVKGKNHLP